MFIPLAPTRMLASGVMDMPTSPPAPSIETLATTPKRGLKMLSPFMGGAAAAVGASSPPASAKDAVATVSKNRNTNKNLYDTRHSPRTVWKGASMIIRRPQRGRQMTAGQGRVGPTEPPSLWLGLDGPPFLWSD